jgi:hypothetical protein
VILESLDPEAIILLLKSIIHVYGEDDPLVKEYLFLVLVTIPALEFRSSFTLTLDIPHTYKEVRSLAQRETGVMEIIASTAPIDHLIERLHRHTRTLSYIPSNQELFLVFIFYCLELYDIEHREYPMIKWLLHHLYKHD